MKPVIRSIQEGCYAVCTSVGSTVVLRAVGYSDSCEGTKRGNCDLEAVRLSPLKHGSPGGVWYDEFP